MGLVRIVLVGACSRLGALAILVIFGASGNGVAAAEPACEVHIGAAARAERADSRASVARLQIGHLPEPDACVWSLPCRLHRRARCERHSQWGGRHSGSASPSRSQLKWIGKPSPSSMLTTSVSGRPTTLV